MQHAYYPPAHNDEHHFIAVCAPFTRDDVKFHTYMYLFHNTDGLPNILTDFSNPGVHALKD